jgi:hypothetical protein
MRTQELLLAFIVVGVCVASPAHATAQRTFVSSHGSDTNPCSISAPCRSFGAAIVQTTDGGDIVVLDSAGYGPVAITKSVAITAPPGVFAGISVFSGKGVDIATTGLKVTLRGLTITGLGGDEGIDMTGSSQLVVERCDVAGMAMHGVHVLSESAHVRIADVTVRNSASGISILGGNDATLERVRVEDNSGNGIEVSNGAHVQIRDSAATRNGTGINVTSASGSGVFTTVTLDGVAVSLNTGLAMYLYSINGNFVQAAIARSSFADHFGVAIRVETNADPDYSQVTVADSQFLRNAVGISLVQGTVSSHATAVVARNSFLGNGLAVNTGAFGAFLTGGGNTLSIGEASSGSAGSSAF